MDDMDAYRAWAELYPEDDRARKARRDKVITELKACQEATDTLNRQLDESLSTLSFIWDE